MVKMKEIINRKIDSETKETVAFEYVLKGLEGPYGEEQELRVWFEKLKPEKYALQVNKPVYRVFTIIGDELYDKNFTMPKQGMGLDMVVATGLTVLRLMLQDEIAYKEMISYTMADITKDM